MSDTHTLRTLMVCRSCARVISYGEARHSNSGITYPLQPDENLMTGAWSARSQYSREPCPCCGDTRPGSRRQVILTPPYPSRQDLRQS